MQRPKCSTAASDPPVTHYCDLLHVKTNMFLEIARCIWRLDGPKSNVKLGQGRENTEVRYRFSLSVTSGHKWFDLGLLWVKMQILGAVVPAFWPLYCRFCVNQSSTFSKFNLYLFILIKFWLDWLETVFEITIMGIIDISYNFFLSKSDFAYNKKTSDLWLFDCLVWCYCWYKYNVFTLHLLVQSLCKISV